jgi:hypothetical protein
VATTQRPRATDGPALSAVPATKARQPLFKHPWRIAIVLGALIAVINLGIWGLHTSDTSRGGGPTFPQAVQDVTPEPGEIIRPQDTVMADLQTGLTGVLVLSGPGFNERIPEDQLERVAPLGQVSFRPGPPPQDLRQFAPGTWTATVLYWKEGKPEPKHPNGFSWAFRVSA